VNNSTNRIDLYDVYYTQTTGVPSFKHTYYTVTSGVLDGCAIGTPANGTTGYNGNVLDRRPNLVVEAYSPNGIYPIYIRGDWMNNGTFNAGRSNVIFDGTALQNIGGTNLTTFSRLTLQKTGVVRLSRITDIDSSLYLGSGILELNSYTLTLKNPAIGNSNVGTLTSFHSLTTVPAWARNNSSTTTAYVRAETMPSTGIGYLQWNIGNVATVPSSYIFPFGSGAQGASTGTYVPIDLDYTTANTNFGNMKLSTYATPPNNLEMPTGVGHINGSVLSPNDPNMIDRYWIMEKSGAATSGAGFKIRWAAGEIAANNPAPYAAQRWWGTGWPNPGIGTNTPANTIVVTAAQLDGYTVSGAPGGWFTVNNWAAAGLATPLPIELLSFDAQLKGDEVHLKWTTASEKDNDFFTIEKTRDANEFNFVAKVPSRYNNSTFTVDYSTIDREPFRGLSYYRLGQTDFDGTTTFTDLVPVNYNYSIFDIVSTVSTERNLIVAFGYDAQEPVNYIVTDLLGRVMSEKENNKTREGTNILNIDATGWTEGVYFITLYNSEKSINRKIFYSIH
ncbi:MAG: T9SS type A sorting domain-containing protein, partial [Bacteroidia bacterium]